MIANELVANLGITPEAWGCSDDATMLAFNLASTIKPKRVLVLGASNASLVLYQLKNEETEVDLIEENKIVSYHFGVKTLETEYKVDIQTVPLIDCHTPFGCTQIYDYKNGKYDFIIVDGPRFAGSGRGLTLVNNDLVADKAIILWAAANNSLVIEGIKQFEQKFKENSITSFFTGQRDGLAITFVYPEKVL